MKLTMLTFTGMATTFSITIIIIIIIILQI